MQTCSMHNIRLCIAVSCRTCALLAVETGAVIRELCILVAYIKKLQDRSPFDMSKLPYQGQQATECSCGCQGRICRATNTQQHGETRAYSHSYPIG